MLEIGVIIARFQVSKLHAGHLRLIKEVSKRHERIVVFLGVSKVPGTASNPLDFQSRAQMVADDLPRAIIHPLPDMPSDVGWSNNLDETLHLMFPLSKFVLYGGPSCFKPHYKGRWPVTVLETYSSTSGTETRSSDASLALNDQMFRAGAIYASQNRYQPIHSVVDIAVLRHSPTCAVDVCAGLYGCGLEVLMGRKPNEAQPGGYRFIGGFVDAADASMEAAAKRECIEEAGFLEYSSMTYVGSAKINDWRYRGTGEGIMTALYYSVLVFGAPEAGDDMAQLQWVPLRDVKQLALDVHKPLASMLLQHLLTDKGDIIHVYS